FSASSMYAAWQAGLKPEPPVLQAQMANGSWKTILPDMGFPAGLPRTITVDLTGKLPAATRRLRIVTNLQIYWDQVLVDNGPDRTSEIRQTELPLALSTLKFRGYPQQIEQKSPGDLTYRYDRISATGPFARQRGEYTHYGNVTPLLKTVDNRFVIFGSGEDIDAEFSAAALPPLPANWKRDYFFYANGYVKDMDFYEASPFTVNEMPFHGMKSYPYASPAAYPMDPSTLRYRLRWNNRFNSGESPQEYRFHYLPANSTPIDPVPAAHSVSRISDIQGAN
ncbi:MAG: FG-GAP-like repeat-containing protein, partial [Acidobacteriaceae bacterium]